MYTEPEITRAVLNVPPDYAPDYSVLERDGYFVKNKTPLIWPLQWEGGEMRELCG